MPHIITYTEEIEEHGYCQQRPELKTGDKYLHEVDGKQRLRIVLSVRFDKYVWENVAQWTTVIEEYFEEEYTLCVLSVDKSDVPVFVAHGMIGVLTCDKDKICGELVIPPKVKGTIVKGVARYGFFECPNLTKVVFSPMVVIAYEYAFAKSGIEDMAFNEEVAVMVHITAVDDCERLPKFDRIFDRPFPGLYLMRGGEIFQTWEENLRKDHFII
ncbi:hypothetical protein [Prevotella sp. Rep29]|uniref:hypothetical protein n=1 Tax=Prevotella sp. Rep29 TaxID=2691580 RepID=UPI001C6F1934|nr:hypothetical protein [Prevotella sp. Rep29]QYR11103.1 hypothetical protein GRF55_08400 [Prevotella sp. Rep29]